jgi:hypothetical protein
VNRPRRFSRPAAAALTAVAALALGPGASVASAHGSGSPPAGGGETVQVIAGSIGAALVTAVMLLIVVGHRRGQITFVGRLAGVLERSTGFPGWASVPIAVLGGALLTAVFGMYWDISTHIDAGRDPGPFANASHYFILAGLFGILFAGLLAVFMPRERPSATALRIREGWYAPLGGALILLCGALALSGFPLDDVWHRVFGQDVTLWGPTHLLLFGAAGLSVLGAWVLLVEGMNARTAPPRAPRFPRVRQAMLGGGFLVALSTFQGEFDFAVPQFRLVFHPILLMLAAGIALVAARVYFGRGGALLAVAGFIAIRGVIALFVGPLFGHTTLHFPLYIVEAVVVELVALRVSRERPVLLGALAGVGIGTLGLAAEWAWSYAWWTISWPSSMLLEGAIAGFVTAVAAGVVGGYAGRALAAPELAPRPAPRFVLPVATVALVAVVAYALPISSPEPPVAARFALADVVPPPERAVQGTIAFQPADAAEDARWLNVTAWQGEGKAVVDDLQEVRPGVYRTTQPIPVHPNWKTTVRLHRGDQVLSVPLYMPGDPAIPAAEVPTLPAMTRPFDLDKKNLQREQKPGVSGALTLFAYLSVLVIAVGLIAALGLGLRRLQQQLGRKAAEA